MKHYFTLLFTILHTPYLFSQTSSNKYNLNIENSSNTIIATRGGNTLSNDPKNEYHTLGKGVMGKINGKLYWETNVLLDIEKGKELAFWPSSYINYYDTNKAVIVSVGAKTHYNHDIIYGFSSKGKPIYIVEAEFQSKPISIKLVKDLSKAYFVFNSDIWEASFDSKTGLLSNHKQLSHSGIFDRFSDLEILQNGTILGLSGKCAVFIPAEEKSEVFTSVRSKITPTSGFLYINDDFSEKKVVNVKNLEEILVPHEYRVISILDYSDSFKLLCKMGDSKTILATYENKRWNTMEYKWLQISDFGTASFSPNKNRLVSLDNSSNFKKFFVYDFDHESPLDVELELIEYSGLTGFDWISDDAFIFNAVKGMKLSGETITSSTQGTYIYLINERKYKKLTPYLSSGDPYFVSNKAGDFLPFLNMKNTDYFLIKRNNYLFKCSKNGDNVTLLFSKPDTFEIRGTLFNE